MNTSTAPEVIIVAITLVAMLCVALWGHVGEEIRAIWHKRESRAEKVTVILSLLLVALVLEVAYIAISQLY